MVEKQEAPLVVIVGETASGKSALAIELAERFDGEIICADSRTIYKGMDIGTAKPTVEEQKRVPHHTLDVVEPTSIFSAAQFKQMAQSVIQDISGRGKLPILVGGTGLYVDAVLYDFQFREPADPAERARLSEMSVQELQKEIVAKGLGMPANEQNPRHLARVLETNGSVGEHRELRPNTLVLGLSTDRMVLQERVERRVDAMLAAGLEGEVRGLAEHYGWGAEAMKGIGYREWQAYFAGAQSLAETRAQIVAGTMALAKRQRTWFKRNSSIQWLYDRSKAVDLVTTFLNKTN